MGALPWLDRDGVASFVDAAPARAVRVLLGPTAGELAGQLSGARLRRPVVHLPLPSRSMADGATDAALSGLARAAAEIWPFWWDGEDLSEIGGDPVSAMHLPFRLRAVGRRVPALATSWARTAVARLVRGLLPRVRDASPEVEAEQLGLALAPNGLVLAADCGFAITPRQVALLEWLAGTTGAAVLALARTVDGFGPPLDRILYGGRAVATEAGPHRSARAVSDPGSTRSGLPESPTDSAVLARPEVVGRPHPLSAVEQRMAKLIAADPELCPLFAYNREVAGLRGPRARVDLVWTAGRVVVEFDGDEHARAGYRADRHRDYELLCAGYLVLRITNAEVTEDAVRAREKIRDVVRLRGRPEEDR